jgi:LPXTG-motif cell wall-anchored protein
VTLDLNGHTLDVSSISVATGGNISSSLAGARINANNSIIVSADAELDTTNITVMIKPHTTNADDPSSIVLIALALGVVIALAIFLIRRRKKK